MNLTRDDILRIIKQEVVSGLRINVEETTDPNIREVKLFWHGELIDRDQFSVEDREAKYYHG